MADLSKLRDEANGNAIDETVKDVELEKKVEEGLEQLPEGEDDTPERPVVKPNDTETNKAEPEPELDDEGEPVTKKDEPVLPDSYYRAAKHQGWSEEEIKDFFDSDPERALRTFGKIYESTNFISTQTAALGRMHVQIQKQLETASNPKQEDKPKTLDVAALRKRIGEEDTAALAILEAVEFLTGEVGNLKQTKQPSNQNVQPSAEESEIWNKINGFFNDEDIQLYGDLYGKTESNKAWDGTLTGDQMKNRMSLIQQADQIRAGAMLQGTNMDYDEALQRAHLVVSDKMKEKVIRTKIVGQLKTRENGITVRGSVQSRKSAIDSNAPPSLKKAEGTVKRGLRKFFGGNVE